MTSAARIARPSKTQGHGSVFDDDAAAAEGCVLAAAVDVDSRVVDADGGVVDGGRVVGPPATVVALDAGGLVGGGVVVRGLEFAASGAPAAGGPERFVSVVATVRSASPSIVVPAFVCIARNV